MDETESLKELPSQRIRVLIADDHPAIRERLYNLITRQADLELVAQAVNGREAYELTLRLDPDVLVLDFEMPEMDGVEVARLLKSKGCRTSILIFSAHVDPLFIQSIIAEGISGYLAKDDGPEKLLRVIRTISQL